MNTQTSSESTAAAALNPLIALFMASQAKKLGESSRPDAPVGKFELNTEVTVRLRGTVNVGEDYVQQIVGKARPYAMLAACLEENRRLALAAGEAGIDMARIVELAEAVDEALEERVEADAKEIVRLLKSGTETRCKGKVNVKGSLEVVGARALP